MQYLPFGLRSFLPALGLVFGLVQAQFISHGPVVGNVSPTAATFYIRTHSATPFELQLSPDPGFASGVLTFTDSTRASRDSSVLLRTTGLQPYTLYHYRLRVGGTPDSLQGQFRTFPEEGERGHYTWLSSSCQESGTYNAMTAAQQQGASLFLHTGDFTYPDYQMSGDYRTDYSRVIESYRRRYSEPKMPPLLRSMAFDYVVDNHDGPQNNVGGLWQTTWYTQDSAGNVTNHVGGSVVTQQQFSNVLRGYYEHFPAYPSAIDSTKGMYHSYRYGNAEVFFLDVRNCGNQIDSLFRYDSTANLWSWDPYPGATMLGATQKNWLKQGLLNSTADWKFIVGGVMFNRQFSRIIEYAMLLQNLVLTIGSETNTGFKLAHSMAYNWAGFKAETQELLDFIDANNIRDVVCITGHVHTSVMDDGTNAGLPELNCGPLAGWGAEFTYYLDSVMQVLGFPPAQDSLWNGGGLGVNNKNFNSAFGRIDIHGNDSLALSVIDENNSLVARMVLPHSSKTVSRPERLPLQACVLNHLQPNPTQGRVRVHFCPDFIPGPSDRAFAIGPSGQMLKLPLPAPGSREWDLDLSHLSAGAWQLAYGSLRYLGTLKVVIAP